MARLFDDAQNEYIEIEAAPVTGPPFTMAGWFYSDDTTIRQTIISIPDKDVTNRYYILRLEGDVANDPVAYAAIGDGGACLIRTTTGYSANTWHHACGICAASDDHRVYLDGGGKTTESGETGSAPVDRTSIGRLGYVNPNVYQMSGRLAEVAVWNAALTDAEVAILAKGYSPLFVRPQNLVAYWPLIRDEDQDRVGGYDMTAFNAPSIAPHAPVIYPAPPHAIYVSAVLAIPRHPATIFQCPAIV